MATSYPGGLDNFTNPSGSMGQPGALHSTQHANINDAVEAVQAELGVNPAGTEDTVAERLDTMVVGTGITNIEQITQAAYNLLTPDANTLYVIVG